MSKHKLDAGNQPESNIRKSGYFWIEIRPDNIIFVEPTGYITGEVVERELARLKDIVVGLQHQGQPVLILINIGKITGHTSESRTAIKQASQLPFDRGAAYGGSLALGMVMQYLQRSIDARRAHYFRTESAALAYLKGEDATGRPGYHSTSIRFITISLFVIVLLSVLSFLNWNYSRQQVNNESHTRFVQSVQRNHSDLQKRMDVYIQALYGFRGLFNASNSVERNEFSAYFKSLNLTSEFPGFSAISFVKHVPSSDLAKYVASVKNDKSMNKVGYPNFAIYPASTKSSYDVVTYSVPDETANPGFDLSSDPTRKVTLDAARDSGLPQATQTVTFTSSTPTKGFLVTLPLYKGMLPQTIDSRRAQLLGYVNAVFRYNALFTDAFTGLDDTDIGVLIRDEQNQVVFSKGFEASEQTIADSLEVAGRKLHLTFNAPVNYGLSRTTRNQPLTVLSSGLFTLLLICIILGTLLRSRGRAVRLAETMTTDLEHERNLAIENQHKLELSERALAAEKASVERKVIERTQELTEARAQLEASLRGLPFGFVILNHNQTVTFSNEALEQILAQFESAGANTTGDVLSRLSTTLKPQVSIAQLLGEAESARALIKRNLMLGTRFLDLLCIPIVGPEARLLGSVIIVEDVTDEKALQRARDEFFSIASHELRTPLTAMRGNASMILESFADKIDDPTVKQMLVDIESSSKRLIDLVSQFLYMSELEQGRVNVTKATVDIGQLASQIIDEFRDQAAKQNLALNLDRPDSRIDATADTERIKQIVRNLISNALRFTTAGSVTLSVRASDGVVKLSVTDTGSGIPDESQHLLFRKFQQASGDMLTRESSQSTGLGLYVSKLIAELMGGKLYLVQSQPGQGSTFTLELPETKI